MRALAVCILLVGVARADDTADLRREIEDLKAQLAAQSARLDQLAAAQQTARPFFKLGGLDVRASGFVQADAVAYDDSSVDEINFSTGQPINNTRFLIRRARLRIEGDYKYAGGVLEFDGNTVSGPVARITNAEVYGRLPSRTSDVPYLMVSVGLTRIPFGFEVQEKDYVRLFLERSNVARALFPGEYDLGAKLGGGWRFLRYQLAVMNGAPSGDKQFALRDPNKSKDILGRLGVDTALGGRVQIAAGLSGLYGTGFHEGTAATKDTLVWVDSNLDGQVDPSELVGVLGMTGTPSANFSRWGFGGDLRVLAQLPKVGELAVYGEVTWASNLDRGIYYSDPIAAQRELRQLGWYVAITQQLTRWAAVGVRYDWYNPDADRTEKIAAQIVPRDLVLTTLAVTGAVMYAPYLRLTLEWDHNTNALARAPSGTPTTLGAEQVTLRAQVLF